MTEETLFHQALGMSPGERAAFLDEACAGDLTLRQRVAALLEAHEHPGSFLVKPPLDLGPSEHSNARTLAGPALYCGEPLAEGPGSYIGPYKLLQVIGEGGMGTVFLAEQQEPVQRQVALKVIKPGMDSKQVIARFEAERQALALMDHPNIARVLDAGTTDSGRPYFVMELVKGVPITQYCDDRCLTSQQRLELLVPVCHAVQHAHQKGIIHRDLKPSNVLVCLYDGVAVPKVIDFGVAKATGAKLTDKTLFTEFGSVVGTLEYMSPEQAQLNNLDIDTRSDIYALGVLLYELLTGTTPLERKRLREMALLEVLRLIREEEPQRPSARFSQIRNAECDRGNATPLPRSEARIPRLHELDWMAMKALEKEPHRRYATANDLALDLQRYLADQPVQACPPSAWYHFCKFARRHRTGLVIAGLVLCFLVLLGGGGGWILRDQAARRALSERELGAALEETQLAEQQDQLPDALAALKRAEGLLLRGEVSEELQQRVRRWRAALDVVTRVEAIRLQRAAMKAERFDWAALDRAYGEAFQNYGLDVEGLKPAEAAARLQASPVRERLVGGLDDWVLARWGGQLARREELLAAVRRADTDPWRDRLRAAFGRQDGQALEDMARDREVLAQPPATVLLLAVMLRYTKRHALAIAILHQAQELRPDDVWINQELGFTLMALEPPRAGEAVGFFRVAVARRKDNPVLHYNLGVALGRLGRFPQAEAAYRKARDLQPDFAKAHLHLGVALLAQGKLVEAEASFHEVSRLKPKDAEAQHHLGLVLGRQKRFAAAAAAFQKALDRKRDYAEAHHGLGLSLFELGRFREAEVAYREAIRVKHDAAPAHSGLGRTLAKLGNPAAAEAAYREALRLKKDDAEAMGGLGHVLGQQGKLTEAEAILRTALGVKRNYAYAHGNLGWVLFEQGKLAEAETELRKAIGLQADFAEAYLNLGSVLCRLGKEPEGLAAFRKAISIQPHFAEAHHNLGYVLGERGALPEAEAALREAVRLQPKFAQAQFHLGKVLWRRGSYGDAVAAFKQAVRCRPSWASARFALGAAHARLGQWDMAAAAFGLGLELSPQDHWDWHAWAALQLRTGDVEGYRRACGEMLARFVKTDTPLIAAITARACLLGPDVVSEPKRVWKLAAQAVTGTENHRYYGYMLIGKGLADYRAGQYTAAVIALRGVSLKVHGGPGDATGFTILALAHHHLGQATDARKAFANARAILAGQMPDPSKGQLFGDDWYEWLDCQILYREAEAVLKGIATDRPAKHEREAPSARTRGAHHLLVRVPTVSRSWV